MLPRQTVYNVAQHFGCRLQLLHGALSLIFCRCRLHQRGPLHPLHLQAQLSRASMVGDCIKASRLQGAWLRLPLLLVSADAW
jgi:hypothetical protein